MTNHYQSPDLVETGIGPFPSDWDIVHAGDVFEPVNLRLKDSNLLNDDISILSMTRSQGLILQSEKFDKRVASKDMSNYKIVKHGQLVYGFPIDEGVIAILHRYPFGAVSPAYHVWQLKMEVDITFIDYMMRSKALMQVYRRFSSNVVERRRNLAKRDFVKVPIPLPPLPEQKAIARVLNTVREAIEATDRVIAAAQELKRSMMQHLFTYGPVPSSGAGTVKLKQTEIGEIPEDWDVQKIGDIATTTSGGTPSRENPAYFKGSIPWVKSGELGDSLVRYTEECITRDAIANSNAKIFPEGTLLVAMYGATAGKVGLLKVDASTNQAVCAIFPKKSLSPFYMFYAIEYRRSKLLGERYGGAQPNLSQRVIRSFQLAFPSRDQQDAISRAIRSIDIKIETEERQKKSLETLYYALLDPLMKGKLRVKVD